MAEQLYVGLISGTSMDGVDAVLAALTDDGCQLRHAITTAYPDDLSLRLRDALFADQLRLQDLGRLDVALGHFFADCALDLLKTAGCGPDEIAAIGHHGQTLFHAPDGAEPFTLQIADANVVAARTGITTVADFRRMDIAFGGQGAPLVPAFHQWWLYSRGKTRVVLNLGGIANITVLHASGEVTGFDTGPANTLLDAWVREHHGQPYDEQGDWARSGRVHQGLLDALLADPYFNRPWPKSTGPEYFNLRWLQQVLHSHGAATPSPTDVQATLAELTAASVAGAISAATADCRRVVVCGGGAHNPDLMSRVAQRLAPVVVESSALHGVAPEWVEGAAFAWLARQRLRGLPGNVPGVTGAREAVTLGGVYCPDHGHKITSGQPR
jgi:anhydro-N-acetylmuramic acid kinase